MITGLHFDDRVFISFKNGPVMRGFPGQCKVFRDTWYRINAVGSAAVAQWLERSPREREVVGSIPDRVIPKTL